MSQVEKFRQNAAECQRQAEKSGIPQEKQQWLTIAEHWLKLADAAEQSEADD
ncbi:MAG TPA: hypothetical protein VFA80_18135 [Xanthobacteraceae bacterium]|nr:hypothetical protein [Xanthobacteraceae bacterium]